MLNSGSFMTYSTSFEGIRIIEKVIIPSEFNIKFDFTPVIMDSENEARCRIMQELNYEKITYWLDFICPGSIFVSKDNKWGVKTSEQSDNNVVMMPDEPMDDLISILFHAKLSSIAGQYFFIHYVEVDGFPGSKVKYKYFASEDGYPLPNMVQFMGGNAFYKQPWWARSDPTTFDMAVNKKGQSIAPHSKCSDITFDAVEEQYREALKSFSKTKTGGAGIVDIKKWKKED